MKLYATFEFQDIPTQDAKLERTFSRGASTISSQDGSGTWRPASGIARIQGTASRLVSAASQQRTLSVSASPPRLDSQVQLLFFIRFVLFIKKFVFL